MSAFFPTTGLPIRPASPARGSRDRGAPAAHPLYGKAEPPRQRRKAAAIAAFGAR